MCQPGEEIKWTAAIGLCIPLITQIQMPDEQCVCNERNVNAAYKAANQSVCGSDNAGPGLRAQPRAGARGLLRLLQEPGDPCVPRLLRGLCCGEGNKWLQLTSLFMPGQLFWSLVSSGVQPTLCPFPANSFTGEISGKRRQNLALLLDPSSGRHQPGEEKLCLAGKRNNIWSSREERACHCRVNCCSSLDRVTKLCEVRQRCDSADPRMTGGKP